jgi:hypothetical protein
MKEDEMDWSGSAIGRDEKFCNILGGKTEGKRLFWP